MAKTEQEPEDDGVEQAAALWAVRLEHPAGAADLAEFNDWVARSPAHLIAFDRARAGWASLNDLATLAPFAPRRQRGVARAGFALAVAAAVALVVSALALTRPDYATPVGVQSAVLLPDGSRLELNTASEIDVSLENSERVVRLRRGEAYFEVAHDPARPFRVIAGGSVIEAVGTAFAVRLMRGDATVSVAEGAVRVSRRGGRAAAQFEPAVLHAGEVSSIGATPAAVVALDERELERRLAWRQGFLVFAGEPLSEAIQEISRYTNVEIEIADPALGAVPVAGQFRAGEVDAMLEALETGFGVRVERLGNRHVRLTAAGGNG